MEVRFPSDERPPAWKIAFLQYVIAAVFLCLLMGYWRLQIGQHEQYMDLAERNRIRNLPVIAPRGRILDRDGRVLADSFPAFSVLLLRESAAEFTPEHVAGIARGLQLDVQDLRATLQRTASLPRFQPVLLKQAATLEDISFVESHRVEYPELDLIQVQQRLYPRHQVAAALLGYVGEVPEEMIAKLGSSYRPGDVVGKFGVEAEYNHVLAGVDGMRRVVVNSRGQEVGELSDKYPQNGNDLRLTVDLDLQMAAEASLGDHAGAVVALDPRTGEVLAMVSHPSFDPNDFAKRIDPKEWNDLMNDPMKPLMNKSIQAQLAPGSVFKIVMAAAALETGTVSPEFIVHCAGAVTIYGHLYHDWVFEKHRSHGAVDMHKAIRESCDVFFYTVGKMLGIDKIVTFAKGLGLGARTGIDLPSEAAGLIPSPEWAQRVFKRKWYAGETISVAIGQGAVSVTPLQVAHTIGGIAMGGVFHRPHVVFQDQLKALGQDPSESSPSDFPLSENTLATVKSGMWAVVNEGGGTGGAARSPGIEISGKTGTAQVVSQTLEQSAKSSSEYKSTAWFVGYAPPDKPEIVVAALVMRGEHSAVAVPIVREVIKAYFDKKLGPKPPGNQMETQARVLSQLSPAGPAEPSKPASGQ